MKPTIVFGTRAGIQNKPNESRTIPFIVSTNTRDRHNTKTNPDGWKLDNFRKNPIVGWMHSTVSESFLPSNPDQIIGHDINSHIEGVGANKQLLGVLKFDPPETNLLAEKVYRKVLFGSLRACSASFLEVGRGVYGKGEEGKGMSQETYYFSGQELIEWSIVTIPSNPDTGKQGKRKVGTYSQSAIMYALRMLGKEYRASQITEMRVKDLLDLLDGKDLGLKINNPYRVRELIKDERAIQDINSCIEQQQAIFKKTYLNYRY